MIKEKELNDLKIGSIILLKTGYKEDVLIKEKVGQNSTGWFVKNINGERISRYGVKTLIKEDVKILHSTNFENEKINNKEVALKAIGDDFYYFSLLTEELKNDKDIIIYTLKTKSIYYTEYTKIIPKKFLNDREFLTEASANVRDFLHIVDKVFKTNFLEDRELVDISISNGLFTTITGYIKRGHFLFDDKELMLKLLTMEQGNRKIRYEGIRFELSHTLKNDKDIIVELIKNENEDFLKKVNYNFDTKFDWGSEIIIEKEA